MVEGLKQRWHRIQPVEGATKHCQGAAGEIRNWANIFFSLLLIGADFWEGDATNHFSVKTRVSCEKGGGIQ